MVGEGDCGTVRGEDNIKGWIAQLVETWLVMLWWLLFA